MEEEIRTEISSQKVIKESSSVEVSSVTEMHSSTTVTTVTVSEQVQVNTCVIYIKFKLFRICVVLVAGYYNHMGSLMGKISLKMDVLLPIYKEMSINELKCKLERVQYFLFLFIRVFFD